jgi:hypothetical protein
VPCKAGNASMSNPTARPASASLTSTSSDNEDNSPSLLPALTATQLFGKQPNNVPQKKGLSGTPTIGEATLMNVFGSNGVMRRKTMYLNSDWRRRDTSAAKEPSFPGHILVTSGLPTKLPRAYAEHDPAVLTTATSNHARNGPYNAPASKESEIVPGMAKVCMLTYVNAHASKTAMGCREAETRRASRCWSNWGSERGGKARNIASSSACKRHGNDRE